MDWEGIGNCTVPAKKTRLMSLNYVVPGAWCLVPGAVLSAGGLVLVPCSDRGSDRHPHRHDETAARRGPQREGASHQFGTLAHADQADATLDAGGALWQPPPVILDVELDPPVALAETDARFF